MSLSLSSPRALLRLATVLLLPSLLAVTAPAMAAPAPPVVQFPAQAITTSSSELTIAGTAPVGTSVVIFADSDRDGLFHSIHPNWYRPVAADGTFAISTYLLALEGANSDLYAFTYDAGETSALVKLPTITHQTGAPAASVLAQAFPPVVLTPAPLPVPAAAEPPVLFQAGETVEFRQFAGADWRIGIVTAVDPAVPTYVIQFDTVIGPVEEVFYPDNVRALTGTITASDSTGPGGTLELGVYACTYDYWNGAPPNARRLSESQGYFELYADGTYSWLDNGGSGEYAYDEASGALTWLSGPLAEKLPDRTTYRRNQATTQIDILFADPYEWSCGHNF